MRNTHASAGGSPRERGRYTAGPVTFSPRTPVQRLVRMARCARAARVAPMVAIVACAILASIGCSPASAQDLPFDSSRLLEDLRTLSHDSMQGRRTGTPGNERARRFLLAAFDDRGIPTVSGERSQEFDIDAGGGAPTTPVQEPLQGLNIFGMIEGSELPTSYIVVTAHFDHLGTRGDDIYNGADDNASGTAALLAIAEAFRQSPPRHSIVLAALDAEEMGLLGGRAFVDDPPIPLAEISLDVNLDMVSRSEAGELYVAGLSHYPSLEPIVVEVAERSAVELLSGHDTPDLPPGDDWTMASDHGPFHAAGIPFAYFGVEDHPGYHRPTDTFETITPEFYVGAVATIVDFIRTADQAIDRPGDAD